MKFTNLQDALDFIQSCNSPNDMKIELMDLIARHVQEGSEIQFAVHRDEIQSVLFQSEHDVLVTVELESVIIHAHSLSQVTSVSTQTKEIKMSNAQNQTAATEANLNEMEKLIATSMQKIMESSLDSVLEAALAKQQARIEETVKKTVDEAMKKSVDEAAEKAVKKAMEEAAKAAPKAEEAKKPTPEQTKEAASGLAGTLGKTAAYLAGAAAIATGGYFAWQKWGGSSSAPSAE